MPQVCLTGKDEKETGADVIVLTPEERLKEEVAELFVSNHEGIIRFLVAGGLSPSTAEEAAQEAFLRLYKAQRRGEDIQQPRSWVYRVARNVALNSRRSSKTHSAFSEALEDAIASSESNAEERLIERESLQAFRQAVKRLSDRQRLCLELRAQGMPYREISEILDIRVSTAAEFVRRGIEELKKWNRQRA
jgi:RNA polymerase sigma-70 factor, ECF subfamily